MLIKKFCLFFFIFVLLSSCGTSPKQGQSDVNDSIIVSSKDDYFSGDSLYRILCLKPTTQAINELISKAISSYEYQNQQEAPQIPFDYSDQNKECIEMTFKMYKKDTLCIISFIGLIPSLSIGDKVSEVFGYTMYDDYVVLVKGSIAADFFRPTNMSHLLISVGLPGSEEEPITYVYRNKKFYPYY